MPLGERLDPADVGKLDAAVQVFLRARDAKKAAEAAEAAAEAELKSLLRRLDLAKANRPSYSVKLHQEPAASLLDESLWPALGDPSHIAPGDLVERLEVRGSELHVGLDHEGLWPGS